MNGRMNGHTMIDELPDIGEQDMEYNRREQPTQLTPAQYQKFIRGSQRLDPDSGMVPQRQENSPPNPQFMPRFMPQNVMPREASPPSTDDGDNLRCIDVARHIQNCPVCQKIYHHDKSPYIIIIIILCIISLLLLKKVLNV